MPGRDGISINAGKLCVLLRMELFWPDGRRSGRGVPWEKIPNWVWVLGEFASRINVGEIGDARSSKIPVCVR